MVIMAVKNMIQLNITRPEKQKSKITEKKIDLEGCPYETVFLCVMALGGLYSFIYITTHSP